MWGRAKEKCHLSFWPTCSWVTNGDPGVCGELGIQKTANMQLVNEGRGAAWVRNKYVTPANGWPSGGDISSAGAGDRTLHGKVARGLCCFFVTWGVPCPLQQ